MTEGNPKTIRDAVLSYNRSEEETRVAQKAQELGLLYFDVREKEFSPDVISLLSVEEAKKGVVPLYKKEKKVIIGSPNPSAPETKRVFDYLSKYYTVEIALISWDALKDLLPRFEGTVKQDLENHPDYEVKAASGPVTFKELETKLKTVPLQEILSNLVRVAIDTNSSDIHIEPEREGARIRLRIDGVLHIAAKIDLERFNYLLSQIELTGGMKLNSNQSQEGRFEVSLNERTVSVRIETMPTLHGDDISLRIFNTEATMLVMDDLGINDYQRKIIDRAVARPQGMILVVGPTGAGKTSTTYAILNTLNKPEVKIITLEDPIEYALSGITQSQIDESESFYERLKAVLREDPDIVMVGEIREKETAEVALHAALTGHVMISTFHANDAPTALSLLKEIAGNQTLLASAINMIVAQRLVRRLCECKKVHLPTDEEKEFIEKNITSLPQEVLGERKIEFYEPVGCSKCSMLGYKGRIGIFEVLSPSVEFQKIMVRPEITVAEIKDTALKSGMITMEQDGLIKSLDGLTAISEVMKTIRE